MKQELKVKPGKSVHACMICSYLDILSPLSSLHVSAEIVSLPQEFKHSFGECCTNCILLLCIANSHLPTLIVHSDLPGVEAVAHTHVIITNSSQTFVWDGHGFKLTIPQDSLPAGVDQCQLDIKASVAGQYQFPDNLQLVSGVFWMRLRPSGRFQQQLTVEIQHCAKMTSSTKLSFVRAHCSQESLPYTFKQLKGCGSFTVQRPYGSLELSQFSGLAVTGEDVEREYTASLYYFGSELHSREIHFVVNWNDAIHRTVSDHNYVQFSQHQFHSFAMHALQRVSEEYCSKEAILGVNHIVEFENDSITLDIPTDGAEVNEGWKITPLFYPMVKFNVTYACVKYIYISSL